MNKRAAILIISLVLGSITFDGFACTTFVISGKYTPDGKPILFKNRDTGVLQNSLVYFTDGKYKYVGLVNGTKEWNSEVWGGYNEAGFAIINSAAYNNNVGDTTKFQDQEGILMKRALQTCATIEDFERMLGSLPKPLGVDANFGVIDAVGGAAYYETGNWDFTKFDANDPKVAPNGIIVRTNHSTRADLTKGFGFVRYHTAEEALALASDNNMLNPQYLFNHIPRNLNHSLTHARLWDDLPAKRDVPEFRFFIDYIPRISTASSIMIVGAPSQDQVAQTMMWSIIGFPLTSVAVPVWLSGGSHLPKVVSMGKDYRSPLCTGALKLKEACFPITYDKGNQYINLSAVINQQQNGIMQLLQPAENEIFNKAQALISQSGKKGIKESDIQNLYSWIDQYLAEVFKSQFNIELF